MFLRGQKRPQDLLLRLIVFVDFSLNKLCDYFIGSKAGHV